VHGYKLQNLSAASPPILCCISILKYVQHFATYILGSSSHRSRRGSVVRGPSMAGWQTPCHPKLRTRYMLSTYKQVHRHIEWSKARYVCMYIPYICMYVCNLNIKQSTWTHPLTRASRRLYCHFLHFGSVDTCFVHAHTLYEHAPYIPLYLTFPYLAFHTCNLSVHPAPYHSAPWGDRVDMLHVCCTQQKSPPDVLPMIGALTRVS
jgi:hypothetical protein